MSRAPWLLLAMVLTSAAGGKLLHSKPDSGSDKTSSNQGHSIWRRSIDMSESRDHMGDTRIPREVVPTGYHVELEPYLDKAWFVGRVWINITCLEGTDVIVLHVYDNLNISHSDVVVRKNVQDLPTETTKGPTIPVSSTKKDRRKEWYIINLTEKLKKNDNYVVTIKYSGLMDTDDSQGLFRSSYIDHNTKKKMWFAATNMRPTNARRVFPCFDEPSFKTPFTMRIAKQDDYEIIASLTTDKEEEESGKPGWSWQHFQKSPPISTLSLGFVIAKLASRSTLVQSSSSPAVSVYGRPQFIGELNETLKLAETIITFMQDYLGMKFPSKKFDIVALPHVHGSRPADHWSLVMFRESELAGDTKVWHIAQEVVTQWVGQLVTPHWWNYGEMNLALTNYLVNVFTMQWKKQFMWSHGYSMYYGYSKRHPFANLGPQIDTIKANKCTWFLRMLNYTLTDQTFRSGFKKFLEDRQYKTFSENDVWAAMTSQGHKDGTLPEDINVADIAKPWLTNERFPVVTVNRNYEDNTADVQQHMFLRERPHDVPDKDKMLWYIPIMYLTPDNMDITTIRPAAWMKNEREITLRGLPSADKFIILNPAEIGMFMVNYDMNNWALLSDALLAKKLPSAIRTKLLHDALNLAYAGELNFASALNMTLFLKSERDPRVWDVMFTMIDHIGRHISGTEAGVKFEEYCRRLLNSLLNSMDEDTKWSNFGLITKQVLSQISYQPYISTARDVYRQWMDSDDPDAGNPVPEKYFCSVFEWGSMDEWEFGLQRVINFPEDRKKSERYYLLKTLAGCPRQADKINRLLNITLSEENCNFTDSDIRLILSMLTGASTGYTTLLKFLNNNWDLLRERYGNKTHLWEYLISTSTGSFKNQEGLDMVSELYVARQGEFGNADPIIERSIKTIKEEARWTDENLPTMEAWLEWALAMEDSRTEHGTYPMG